jgi:hypothetical protein
MYIKPEVNNASCQRQANAIVQVPIVTNFAFDKNRSDEGFHHLRSVCPGVMRMRVRGPNAPLSMGTALNHLLSSYFLEKLKKKKKKPSNSH